MRKPYVYALALLPLLPLAGCAQNGCVKTTDQLCPQGIAGIQLMAAAENVLAEMHFTIDKSDVNASCIRTHPLSGAQSFEFWRSDSVGSFNRAEADLQSIRRTVEINLSEQSGRLCLYCTANTQRLSLPERQVDTSHGYAILSESQRSLQRLKLSHEQKANMTWIDLGRDNRLETEILARIEKRLAGATKEKNQ